MMDPNIITIFMTKITKNQLDKSAESFSVLKKYVEAIFMNDNYKSTLYSIS